MATSRSLSSLHSLRSESAYSPSQLLILPLDVTSVNQIEDVFTKTREKFGRLDVVINNAGYGVNGEMESTPDDVARQQMEVCFWGAVNVMREASIMSLFELYDDTDDEGFFFVSKGDPVLQGG